MKVGGLSPHFFDFLLFRRKRCTCHFLRLDEVQVDIEYKAGTVQVPLFLSPHAFFSGQGYLWSQHHWLLSTLTPLVFSE